MIYIEAIEESIENAIATNPTINREYFQKFGLRMILEYCSSDHIEYINSEFFKMELEKCV